MGAGSWMMVVVIALALASLAFIVFTLVRSIITQRSGRRGLWREFGLGLALMILFFVTWGAQAIAEWQVFTDEQNAHGEAVELGDFVSTFGQSTLENWQSEFLQLFAFVVLAALYIHKGSAESKDSDEKVEASLRRIEEHLGTIPDRRKRQSADWQLPDTPMDAELSSPS
jgi:hypothetical protein